MHIESKEYSFGTTPCFFNFCPATKPNSLLQLLAFRRHTQTQCMQEMHVSLSVLRGRLNASKLIPAFPFPPSASSLSVFSFFNTVPNHRDYGDHHHKHSKTQQHVGYPSNFSVPIHIQHIFGIHIIVLRHPL